MNWEFDSFILLLLILKNLNKGPSFNENAFWTVILSNTILLIIGDLSKLIPNRMDYVLETTLMKLLLVTLITGLHVLDPMHGSF